MLSYLIISFSIFFVVGMGHLISSHKEEEQRITLFGIAGLFISSVHFGSMLNGSEDFAYFVAACIGNFLISYVFFDSNKRGMDKLNWSILVFFTSFIGFSIYLFKRKTNEEVKCSV